MPVFIAFGIRVVDIVGFIVHMYHYKQNSVPVAIYAMAMNAFSAFSGSSQCTYKCNISS